MALCHTDENVGASPTGGAHAEVEEEATNPQEVGDSVSTEKGEFNTGPRDKPPLLNAEQAIG
jgi:hypothetical protein